MSFRLIVLVWLLFCGARHVGSVDPPLTDNQRLKTLAVSGTKRPLLMLVQASGLPEFRLFKGGSSHRSPGQNQLVIGRDLVVAENQSVDGDVVVIHGRVDVRGTINGGLAVVGSRGDITGTVKGDLACVASVLRLADRCTINGDFTSVASAVDRQDNVDIHGSRTNVEVFPRGTVGAVGDWLSGTVLLFRPMAPRDALSWSVAMFTLLFCVLIGSICPRLLHRTGAVLQERATASFLAGIIIMPAAALLCFLLVLTVVGILAIPVLIATVMVFALAGNAAVFQVIGRRLAPKLASHPQGNLLAIVLGAVICWAFYCIPVIGFLVGSVVFVGGLGAFSLYLLDGARPRQPAQRHLEPILRPRPDADEPEVPKVAEAAVVTPSTLAVPRATFWPRLLANLIDLVLVYSLLYFLGVTRVLVPMWVVYRFAMYAWRSTTVGGIVLRLQVIRSDGRFLIGDYSTSLIRALGSLLSLLPFGLGFFWILFDPEKNAWHDHISRTFVVQMEPPRPKALPPQAPAPV